MVSDPALYDNELPRGKQPMLPWLQQEQKDRSI